VNGDKNHFIQRLNMTMVDCRPNCTSLNSSEALKTETEEPSVLELDRLGGKLPYPGPCHTTGLRGNIPPDPLSPVMCIVLVISVVVGVRTCNVRKVTQNVEARLVSHQMKNITIRHGLKPIRAIEF